MRHYRFPIFTDADRQIDDREGVRLPDDQTAITYGTGVIEELKRDEVPPGGYAGWRMEIRESARLVAIIPFMKPN
jgi:hypothetical protein